MTPLGPWEEAAALKHGWVGSEHFLLWIARDESVAGRVLREAGATYESLRGALQEAVRSDPDHPFEPEEHARCMSPAAHELVGFASGHALARGAASADPEDYLVAVLWQPDSLAGGLLERCSEGRAWIGRKLRELGVAMPDADPPTAIEWNQGPNAYFDPQHLGRILEELPSRLPDNANWGWNVNHDRSKAYVSANADVDVQAIVDEILADA